MVLDLKYYICIVQIVDVVHLAAPLNSRSKIMLLVDSFIRTGRYNDNDFKTVQ